MFVEELRDAVSRLKEVKPSGARRLAALMGVPPQTVYAWAKWTTRERSAKKILLEAREAAKDDEILAPVLAPRPPENKEQPKRGGYEER